MPFEQKYEQPLDDKYARVMRRIGALLQRSLDEEFGVGNDSGFILLMYPFGAGLTSYISNSKRGDAAKLMRETSDKMFNDMAVDAKQTEH